MNNLTTTYCWVENMHSKKMFKKRSGDLGISHKIVNSRLSTELKLSDHHFATINTDLIALIQVSKKYASHEVMCYIFNTSLAADKPAGQDTWGAPTQPYRYVRYTYILNVGKNDKGYWLRVRGNASGGHNPEFVEYHPAAQTDIHLLSDDTIHDYVRTLMVIPSIVKEIQKNLLHLK